MTAGCRLRACWVNTGLQRLTGRAANHTPHPMRRIPGSVLLCLVLFTFPAPGSRADEPAANQDLFGDAVLRDWVQPQYPAVAAAAKQSGRAVVEFIVEEDGSVSGAVTKDSTDAAFEAAALAAVRQWKFQPAVEKGRNVRSAMVVPVQFHPDQLKQKRVPISPPDHQRPQGLKLTSAKARVSPDPVYPWELEARKLPGRVDLTFVVDETGRTKTPRVRWASHAAFVESALRAVEKMEFEPAHQGPLAKTTTIESPMGFGEFGLKRTDTLAANRITLVEGPAGVTPPGLFVWVEPVPPLDRCLAGETGTARAEFEVDVQGATRNVAIKEASAPEYAAALQAAIEAWMFQPAMNGTTTVSVRLAVSCDFAPPDGGATGRLAELLRPGGAGIGGAGGLDQRLAPLWRGFPRYPAVLLADKPAGQAEIEFIIDRAGRARLPRVLGATHEAFGWAAATAISQWVFEPPRRNGEAVDVRVSIPVGFKPPAD